MSQIGGEIIGVDPYHEMPRGTPNLLIRADRDGEFFQRILRDSHCLDGKRVRLVIEDDVPACRPAVSRPMLAIGRSDTDAPAAEPADDQGGALIRPEHVVRIKEAMDKVVKRQCEKADRQSRDLLAASSAAYHATELTTHGMIPVRVTATVTSSGSATVGPGPVAQALRGQFRPEEVDPPAEPPAEEGSWLTRPPLF